MTRRGAGLAVIVGFAVAGAGCSTTVHLGPVATPSAISHIQNDVPGARLEAVVDPSGLSPAGVSESPVHPIGTLVAVEGKSALILFPHRLAASRQWPPMARVPLDSVERVHASNRARRALLGGGAGLALGVLAGSLFLLVDKDEECCRNAALVAGVAVGLPAMLLGAVVGAATGNSSDYVFGR